MTGRLPVWTRLLGRLGWEGRRPPPAAVDTDLLALAEAFVASDRALRSLLDGDGRDADDIPGFSDLADRRAELARRVVGTPAFGPAGLLAKARCGRLHPAERGFDAATEICQSLADDVLRIGSLLPFSSSPTSFRPSPDAPPRQRKAQNMNMHTDAERRLGIHRRNEVWRQRSRALSTLGAIALSALVGLPANGVALTLTGIATLVAAAAVTLGLAFFVLRFIDHSA